MCRSTRRPLLCPNCVNRGHLNNLALRTARQHKQKLLERINWALEVQVRLRCSHSSSVDLSLSMLYQGPKRNYTPPQPRGTPDAEH